MSFGVNRIISDYYLKDLVTKDNDLGYSNSDYIILCPYCKDVRHKIKKKLYIRKDYKVGYCFVCSSAFCNPKDELEKELIARKYVFEKSKNIEFLEPDRVDIKFYEIAKEDINEEGEKYLRSRPDKHLIDDYKRWGIRFTKNSCILPINQLEGTIYYQIRYFDPSKHKAKYFMPKIEHKPFSIVQRVPESKKAIITEGIFGGIAVARSNPKCNVLAMLGKHLTEYQAWLLERLNIEDYIIFLDETELSINFQNEIKESGLYYNNLYHVETKTQPDETYGTPKVINDTKPINTGIKKFL